jgi:hypothetical protein
MARWGDKWSSRGEDKSRGRKLPRDGKNPGQTRLAKMSRMQQDTKKAYVWFLKDDDDALISIGKTDYTDCTKGKSRGLVQQGTDGMNW